MRTWLWEFLTPSESVNIMEQAGTSPPDLSTQQITGLDKVSTTFVFSKERHTDPPPINQSLSDTFSPELIHWGALLTMCNQQEDGRRVYQAQDSISQTLQHSFLLIELGRGRKSVWFYPSRDWALLRYPLRLGCWETPQQWREGLVSLRKSPVSRPRATRPPHPCVTTAGNSLLALRTGPTGSPHIQPLPGPASSHPTHSAPLSTAPPGFLLSSSEWMFLQLSKRAPLSWQLRQVTSAAAGNEATCVTGFGCRRMPKVNAHLTRVWHPAFYSVLKNPNNATYVYGGMLLRKGTTLCFVPMFHSSSFQTLCFSSCTASGNSLVFWHPLPWDTVGAACFSSPGKKDSRNLKNRKHHEAKAEGSQPQESFYKEPLHLIVKSRKKNESPQRT